MDILSDFDKMAPRDEVFHEDSYERLYDLFNLQFVFDFAGVVLVLQSERLAVSVGEELIIWLLQTTFLISLQKESRIYLKMMNRKRSLRLVGMKIWRKMMKI